MGCTGPFRGSRIEDAVLRDFGRIHRENARRHACLKDTFRRLEAGEIDPGDGGSIVLETAIRPNLCVLYGCGCTVHFLVEDNGFLTIVEIWEEGDPLEEWVS